MTTIPIITIAGTGYPVQEGSISIDNRLEERSIASLSIHDPAHAYLFFRGQPITITVGGVLEFGGVIDTPSKDSLTSEGYILHSFQCADWHYLADKRLAAVSYINQTCGYIARDLLTNYLAAEGITEGEIQDGPTLTSEVFNYISVSACFDLLKQQANFTWWISPDKKLYFVARSTYPAPWDVTDPDIIFGSAHWAGGNPSYRNTEYIRGGKGLTSLQTETLHGDGNNKAFTVSYPAAQAPTVTVGGVSKTVGVKGIDTGKDFYWNVGDPVVSANTAPANGAAVVIAYYGQYDILVKSTDPAQIAAQQAIEGAGTGIVEAINDDPAVDSLAAGFASAAAQLSVNGQESDQLTFSTHNDGLAVGQMVTITYPYLGINGDQFLISEVKLTLSDYERTYTVTAIRGTLLGSWAKTLGNLLQAKAAGSLVTGTLGTVAIPTSNGDTWSWGDSAAETVHACPVPGPTLYPSPTLYPC